MNPYEFWSSVIDTFEVEIVELGIVVGTLECPGVATRVEDPPMYFSAGVLAWIFEKGLVNFELLRLDILPLGLLKLGSFAGLGSLVFMVLLLGYY